MLRTMTSNQLQASTAASVCDSPFNKHLVLPTGNTYPLTPPYTMPPPFGLRSPESVTGVTLCPETRRSRVSLTFADLASLAVLGRRRPQLIEHTDFSTGHGSLRRYFHTFSASLTRNTLGTRVQVGRTNRNKWPRAGRPELP